MSHQPEFTDEKILAIEYATLHRRLNDQIKTEKGYQQAIDEMVAIMTNRLQVMKASGSMATKHRLEEIESGDMSFLNKEVR